MKTQRIVNKKIKILLIEDNPGDVRLILEMLKGASGYQSELVDVANLEDGLKHLSEETFDVVLLDLGLPDSQGLETLNKINEQVPEVPIVILTGLADEVVTADALHKGAQDYLVKGEAGGDLLIRAIRYAIERKRAEKTLYKVNRALKVLSESNSALVRAMNKSELLHKVCQIIVKLGGYRFAWVGFKGLDEEKTVRPVAYAGYEKGYLDTKKITWANTEQDSNPSATAIQTGKPYIAKCIQTDPGCATLRAEAIKQGYASMIALPLILNKHPFGAINIYSAEPDAFDEEEVKLLMELAEDLAYGIESLRTREERERVDKKLKQSLEKLRRTLEETVNALASVTEKRDPYTAGHQQRMTQLACAIAKEMNLSAEQIEGIHIAGLLHDIGKISVPAEILSKPGKLLESEFEIIKDHPQVGYDILKSIDFPWPIADIVLQHHERLDGSGYPEGLKAGEILLEARILGVADVVEAMLSHRPYRPARGQKVALEEITKNKGIIYDPEVVDACLKLFTKKGFKFE